MTAKDGRRAAERAAREALGARVAAVGDLGAAVARREAALAGPDRARARTEELLTAARAEGRRLAEDARAELAAAHEHYATVYTAATAAGWAAGDLAGLGYDPPPRRRTKPTGAPSPAAGDQAAGREDLDSAPTHPPAST